MQYHVLYLELANDPLGRDYASMSDAEAAVDLGTEYRTRQRATMEAYEVFNAVNKSEWNALTSASQAMVWDIIHMGTVNPFGLEADVFVDIFGISSSTIDTLQGLRLEDISRAEELGLGQVTEGHVYKAKNMY